MSILFKTCLDKNGKILWQALYINQIKSIEAPMLELQSLIRAFELDKDHILHQEVVEPNPTAVDSHFPTQIEVLKN